MNPAVLNVALLGSRSSWGRMAGIGGGVAIGVCLVLLLWSAANGLAQRDARGAWLREMGRTSATVSSEAAGRPGNQPLKPIPLTPERILLGFPVDVFRDQPISHREIAALPTATVKIPGIGAPPAPGQYYASPALQRLIASTPAEELGDRYGKFVGAIDGGSSGARRAGGHHWRYRGPTPPGPGGNARHGVHHQSVWGERQRVPDGSLGGRNRSAVPGTALGQHCDRSGRCPAPGTLCYVTPDRCVAPAGRKYGSRRDSRPQSCWRHVRCRPGWLLQARRSGNTRQRREDVPRRFHVRSGIRRGGSRPRGTGLCTGGGGPHCQERNRPVGCHPGHARENPLCVAGRPIARRTVLHGRRNRTDQDRYRWEPLDVPTADRRFRTDIRSAL